jgi:ribosomal protein L11 methyltransferase
VIRLAIRVRREDAEIAFAELLALVPNGVEEVDLGDRIEYAVYGAPGELPELPDLQAAAGDALVEVVTTEVPDDWGERWKTFHRPVVIGERLRVRPPWVPPLQEIVVDPGQAFGTGAHHTTRLCLDLLLELEPAGAVVDVGCGSGVLAIAAAKLGWSPVLGLDHEAESVAATADNARANDVEVGVRRFDLRAEPVPAAPTVIANLLRPLLLALRFEAVPATLVAGGLLAHEGDEVALALARHGLREARRLEADGWLALVLSSATRPSS